MKFYDNTKYAFIVALIRSFESRMLTSGNVERMIDAKDGKEAYRVLNDLDYAEFLGEAERPEDFQMVINAGLTEAKETILRYTPYPEIMDILWIRFDFHNLKILTKAHLQGKALQESSIEQMLMPFGKYTINELINLLETLNQKSDQKQKKEEIQIQAAIQKAIKIYATADDPALIDAVLDKAYFDLIGTQIQALKFNFLNEYHRLASDLLNIRMYLRSVVIHKTELFQDLLFISGGSLPKETFTGDLETFKQKTEKTGYGKLVENAIKAYLEEKSFFQLEKDSDGMLLDHMLKARYINLGPEPVFAFFWIKENNAQIIRTIMVNKLNNIEPMEIRKKIRKLYQ